MHHIKRLADINLNSELNPALQKSISKNRKIKK